MLSRETHWSRRQRASRFSRVHRGEPVTTERCQSRRQGAGFVRAGHARSAADVKIKFVADHKKSAARGLNIVGVPVALLVGDGTERAPIRPRPMPSVAAV